MSQQSKPITAVLNIANFAVDLVVALGSDTVFSLTGGMAMHINRAVAANDKLTKVYCQHEQAVICAAEGYCHAADMRKAGFAVVTAGPGVTNTVSSLVSAYGDSTPMIVLAGQIKTADIDTFGCRTHGVQEVRSEALISPCVKRFTRLTATGFREELISTITEAFAGRPGPVFIEFPLDMQGLPFTYTPEDVATDAAEIRRRVAQPDVALDSLPKITAAIEELLKATRPVVYIGNGVRAANVDDAALAFLRKYKIPVLYTWTSEDLMPAADPLFFGEVVGAAFLAPREPVCGGCGG